jgi:Hypothetical protein (DUF2513)
MKRDCELVRQILLNIECRGANCTLESLRADLRHESDERVRYHLQLVIDAGWAVEVERSIAGPIGVRLTHAGHEFVELARGDVRWRAAKAVVIEETGGQSLAVVRALLAKWAWRVVVHRERKGRLPLSRRESQRRRSPRVRRHAERIVPAWWQEAYSASPEAHLDDDQVRDGHVQIGHRRCAIRKRIRPQVNYLNYHTGFGALRRDDLYGELASELDSKRDELRPKVTLPPHMI